MPHGFTFLDSCIFAFYFIFMVYIAFRYANNKKGIIEHFHAGKRMGWFIIGTSLFITTVSSEHVIGYPESGYSQGFGAGNFAWGACLVLLLVAWFFVPFYIKNQILTTPEFIEKRFDRNSRWIMSTLSVIVYIITKVSIMLFAGAILLEALLGWDKYTSSLILVIITGIFSVAGGFRGELYSHVFHSYVTIFCATAVTIFGIHYIGGFDALAKVPDSHLQVFEPSNHPDYPWTGMIFGAPIQAIWYWCTDQYMVQRLLSARDIPNARRGALFAGYLMLLPSIILLVPGLVAYVAYGPEAADGKVYLSVITDMLPTGVKALAVIGMLSALISSLAASFHSVSTLYTLDIYTKLYPNAEEFKIVNIGKITTIIVVNLALVWVSFIGYFSDDIIKNLQTIQSYVAPTYTAIFLVGLLWARANASGALTVLIVGSIIGLLRIGLDFFRSSFTEAGLVHDFLAMNFLHQTIFLFLFYVLIMIVVSLLTAPPSQDKLLGLTYKYRHAIQYHDGLSPAEATSWKKRDILLSIVLVIALFTIWGFLTLKSM